MITRVAEPYYIKRNDVDEQFEGRMVALIYAKNEGKESGIIVAHSDGNPETKEQDRTELLDIIRNEYQCKGKMITGYKYDGSLFVTG